MATTLKFDDLNSLKIYREFFGKMFITPKQMQSRIELAEDIESVIIYLFAYLEIYEDAGIPIDEIKQNTKDRLTSVIEKRAKLDPYIEKRISTTIDEVTDTTIKRKRREDEEDFEDLEDSVSRLEREFDEDEESEDDEKNYWTSRERAVMISENEANAFDNYLEYKKAIEQGKTKKTWLTENDERVRFTHTLVEGQTVAIDGLFLVGGSKMRFPMDTLYDADATEIINCRCACVYE